MNAVTTVRELSADERRVYQAANLVAYDQMWYFADALFSVIPVAAPGLGTFAVDRFWRLYLDPALLVGEQAWSVRDIGAVLLHETGHLLRAHSERAAGVPQPVSQLAWNYAGDAEINDDLLAAGLELPEGGVTPQALGFEPGGLAEDYYAGLVDECDPADPSNGGASGGGGAAGHPRRDSGGGPLEDDYDDDGPGCGSGSGCAPVPGELTQGAVIGGRKGVDGATADTIRHQVAEAVRAATAAGRGTVPAGMRRWADDVLTPPVVPWTRVMRSIRGALANVAGRTDYTFMRPSRRSTDILLPGLRGPKVVVAVVVDTSGSMSSADLAAALSELKGVIRSAGVAGERVVVLTVDAKAAAPQRVSRVEDIELIGGGGTDMRVGIAAAELLRPTPQVTVIITDGDTPFPEKPGRSKLVCVIIGNPEAATRTPEFALTVSVPSGAGQRARGARAGAV